MGLLTNAEMLLAGSLYFKVSDKSILLLIFLASTEIEYIFSFSYVVVGMPSAPIGYLVEI